MEKRLTTPFTKDKIKDLKAGDSVLITGTIYTARDAAHERMTTNFKNGIPFPIDLTDNVIYYAGPCPAKPGEVIGSCGPTTAGRMDAYTPMLLDNGLGCMIGKGARTQPVIDAIIRNKGIYFAAIGGAAALISRSIKSSEVLAYEDLGTEAIYRFVIEDFPAVVAVDSFGNDVYKFGAEKYRK